MVLCCVLGRGVPLLLCTCRRAWVWPPCSCGGLGEQPAGHSRRPGAACCACTNCQCLSFIHSCCLHSLFILRGTARKFWCEPLSNTGWARMPHHHCTHTGARMCSPRPSLTAPLAGVKRGPCSLALLPPAFFDAACWHSRARTCVLCKRRLQHTQPTRGAAQRSCLCSAAAGNLPGSCVPERTQRSAC